MQTDNLILQLKQTIPPIIIKKPNQHSSQSSIIYQNHQNMPIQKKRQSLISTEPKSLYEHISFQNKNRRDNIQFNQTKKLSPQLRIINQRNSLKFQQRLKSTVLDGRIVTSRQNQSIQINYDHHLQIKLLQGQLLNKDKQVNAMSTSIKQLLQEKHNIKQKHQQQLNIYMQQIELFKQKIIFYERKKSEYQKLNQLNQLLQISLEKALTQNKKFKDLFNNGRSLLNERSIKDIQKQHERTKSTFSKEYLDENMYLRKIAQSLNIEATYMFPETIYENIMQKIRQCKLDLTSFTEKYQQILEIFGISLEDNNHHQLIFQEIMTFREQMKALLNKVNETNHKSLDMKTSNSINLIQQIQGQTN